MPLALITGASTGIGRATAHRLVADGWTVLAGVRSEAAGGALREGLDGAAAERLRPIALEVTDAGQIEAAAREVAGLQAGASAPGGLDALINNAGIGVGGPLELVEMDELRRQFEVNVFGAVAVMQALLPALRRARGRVLLTSSVGGRVATPFIAPYSASKHAIEALGDALRLELRTSGVQVALIEPGSVATPIWGKSKEEADRLTIPDGLEREYGHVPAAMDKVMADTAARGIPPEQVAATIAKALAARRMRARYVVGRDAHAMIGMRGLLPDLVWDRVLRRALGV